MLNLHEVSPEFPDEIIDLESELHDIYKFHSAHNHLAAIEAVFKAGVEYAVLHEKEKSDPAAMQLQVELHSLRDRFDVLSQKYEILKSQASPTSPVAQYISETSMQEQAKAQAMGMGMVFKQ